jgi:hypothetical protein
MGVEAAELARLLFGTACKNAVMVPFAFWTTLSSSMSAFGRLPPEWAATASYQMGGSATKPTGIIAMALPLDRMPFRGRLGSRRARLVPPPRQRIARIICLL